MQAVKFDARFVNFSAVNLTEASFLHAQFASNLYLSLLFVKHIRDHENKQTNGRERKRKRHAPAGGTLAPKIPRREACQKPAVKSAER